MNNEEKELKLISQIVALMSEFQEGIEEGMNKGIFTEEHCSGVMSSLPQVKEGLIARKDELEELISSNESNENPVQLTLK